EVVNQEVDSSEADHSRWMYRQQHTDPRSNELKECIDTSEGTICRVLARNGHPLTPQEEQQEIQQIQELARNPARLREQQKARRQDADRALKMEQLLPDAFDYEYDGREGRYVCLRFRPALNFRPPDRESRVFHGMVGSLLVDPESKRLVAIKGQLGKDVDFGLGLLGRLIADRKSTRLNSSHLVISYAVFCLKKKSSRYALRQYRVICRLLRLL